MDALDFRILAELHRDARASYEDLGVKVGLTGNAVKSRLKRLTEEGVLRGFTPRPRAHLLGLRDGLLVFHGVDDLDEREHEILQGLTDVPGVRCAEVGHDHSVNVWLLHADETDWERVERAAISLVGKPPAWRFVSDPPADEETALSPADWRIVRALLEDGRRSVKDLARAAGLSFKPLRKRLDALMHDGRIRIEPVLSPSEASGVVLFRVLLFLRDGARFLETRRALPSDALVTVEQDGVVSVFLQSATLKDARAAFRELKNAPGVERALLQIATRRAATGWLDEAIQKRIETIAPIAQPAPKAKPQPEPMPVQRASR